MKTWAELDRLTTGAISRIAAAFRATGEVRVNETDNGVRLSRQLSRGWQDMGSVTLDIDEETGEISIDELPARRRAWAQDIAEKAVRS
jgi:hypothetical protein